MSLSRPIKFPLLKLPLLCIECVVKSCDFSDIIFLALTSKRTRQIVKYVKPLIRIRIFLSDTKWIEIGRESCKTDYGFESYTDKNELIALKMAIKFLNKTFKCLIERVEIREDNFPESGDIGVKSAVNLCIDHEFVNGQSRELKLLLENLEVTGTCIFRRNTENGFYCDPKLFKCKKLVFSSRSVTWVTREFLMLLEVPRLIFCDCPFSVEDIVMFVTQWFYSDNSKFEYLHISSQNGQVPLVSFQTDLLNPLPFNGRNRIPSSGKLFWTGFSAGLELRRNDGLTATIHVKNRLFLFYVWHNE
ncbi:unnamed protein product [Caenorhabditis brenneri]